MDKSRQKIILTGGSGQLGTEIIKTLSSIGYQVVSVDLNPLDRGMYDICPHLKEEICDITNENSVVGLFEKHKDFYGIVNNAGKGVFTPFLDRTIAEFNDVVNLNMNGTFLMCREACKIISGRENPGKIINIASLYGLVSSDDRIYGESGRNNSEVYSMTKAAVIALTKYIAANYGNAGVLCNAVSPGGIFNNQKKDFIENYECRTPIKRMAKAEEISPVIAFLLGKGSSYVNGENIVVDGGFSAW